MTSSTTDLVVNPGDGWTRVAQSPGFLSLRAQNDKDWYVAFVASGAGAPAASLEGEKMTCHIFKVQEPISADVYVRTLYSNKIQVTVGDAVAGIIPTGSATSANQTSQITQETAINANTSPASSTSRIISAAGSTNATSAKGSAGTLRTVTGYNASGSPRYLKFYDKASSPTVGTDTPVMTIYLPALTAFVLDYNRAFTTGIAYALTVNGADADTTALTAGDILGLNVNYL